MCKLKQFNCVVAVLFLNIIKWTVLREELPPPAVALVTRGSTVVVQYLLFQLITVLFVAYI